MTKRFIVERHSRSDRPYWYTVNDTAPDAIFLDVAEFRNFDFANYLCDLLNELADENKQLKQQLSGQYLEKGSVEYYKQLFDEKCTENEVLQQRVNWFIECIERMGYTVVKE